MVSLVPDPHTIGTAVGDGSHGPLRPGNVLNVRPSCRWPLATSTPSCFDKIWNHHSATGG